MSKLLDFSNTRISFKRNITDYAKVRMLIATLIRNRRKFFKPFPKEGDVYLDIGCGPNIDHKFYNIDYSWQPGIDRCMDVTRGLGLPTDSVSGIFTEHCIEHIDIEDTMRLLIELRKILQGGAVLRIVVPDAELHARAYIQSLEIGVNKTPFAGQISRCGISTPVMSINDCMREHGHRFIYDYQTLYELLSKAGFSEVYKRAFRVGNDSMLMKDADSRKLESLYVEAVK